MDNIWQLVTVFFKIGLFSIGGGYAVIPAIRQQVVTQLGWISDQVFTDIITISQMTPGPLAVNTSTFVGIRIAGIPGAILATFGCVISGITISTILYRFFKKHGNSAYAAGILGGLKASSLGLIVSAAVTLVLLAVFGVDKITLGLKPDIAALLLFVISVILLRKWKINPMMLMVLTGIAGVFLF